MRGPKNGRSLLGLFALGTGIASTRFGGEDPLAPAPDGDNWHHEGLTRRAAQAAGWSQTAENALAFHADYVDSYLYNPLWWLDFTHGGGWDRLRVVMSSQADLVNVHFDDLFDTEAVLATWRRYLSGTVAGLLWVQRQDLPSAQRVSMAHNLVGVSLHAIQDFYSHSNWINDEKRRTTFFNLADVQRRRTELWTGAYETPERFGVRHHGKYLIACTVLNNVGLVGRGMLRVMCHAASPFSKSTLCEWLKECQEAQPINPEEVAGLELDPVNGVLWVKPGINVDSMWQAPLGAQERGFDRSEGLGLFRLAYNLAYRTSCEWLHQLDHIMEEAGLADFWAEVKTTGITTGNYLTDLGPYEDFNQLPYRFISTGQYPPLPNEPDTDKWYVRLTVATADEANAGTDADIIPIIDGQRFGSLDHAPRPPRPEAGETPRRGAGRSILGINDHERGDVRSYMIGPLDAPPGRIELLNDAPSVGDLITAAAEGVWNAVTDAFEAIGDFFLSLIGFHADFVDEGHAAIPAAALEGLAPGETFSWSIRCNGGSEGDYEITGHVRATNTTGTLASGVRTRTYDVHVDELICIEESDWDRFTSSDEPFVLGLVMGHGGGVNPIRWRTGPFSDVDTGEHRLINRDFQVTVPRTYGFISVAVAVYESDDESSSDRDDLLDGFADNLTEAVGESEDGFLVLLGESIASGWKLDWFEAVAFQRAETVDVRFYERESVNQWISGGEWISRQLSQAHWATARVPDMVTCDCSSRLVAEIDIPAIADRQFGPPRNGRDRIRERLEEAAGGEPDHEKAPGRPPGLTGRKTPRMVPGKPPKRSVRHRRRRNA